MANSIPNEDKRSISFPVIRIRQPIGELFVGAIPHQTLIEISDFDIRKLLKTDDFEDFVGIQRKIDLKRIEQIRKYIETVDATFPTRLYCQ